jgi:hypothetical protein
MVSFPQSFSGNLMANADYNKVRSTLEPEPSRSEQMQIEGFHTASLKSMF